MGKKERLNLEKELRDLQKYRQQIWAGIFGPSPVDNKISEIIKKLEGIK
jgi:hypothetical protein